MNKELILSIDGTVVPVLWEDNDAVHVLTEHASTDPVKVQLSLYGGWEQVGDLGFSLPRDDIQLTAENGDIMLYSGDKIVLFYGNNSWAYTKLGRIALDAETVTQLLSRNEASILIYTYGETSK